MRSNVDLQQKYVFIVLILLMTLTLFTGGTSRYEYPSLVILRPVSIFAFFYAIYGVRFNQIRPHLAPISLVGCIFLLVSIHLVPLPPGIWQGLPGRESIIDVMALNGTLTAFQPISMVPHATLNALYFLFLPIAVMILAIRAGTQHNFLLVVALQAMFVITAFVGIVQASGVDIRLYPYNSEMSGLFANRNHQAVAICLLVPISAVVFDYLGEKYSNFKLQGFIFIAICVITLGIIVITGSRTGLALYFMSLALTFFLKIRLYNALFERNGKTKWPNIFIASCFAIFVIIATFYYSSRGIVSRFDNVTDDPRLPVWREVAALIPTYMPFGSGVGSYPEVYQIHEPQSLLSPSYSNHAHNDWLEVLMTAGVPGVCLVVAGLVLTVVAVPKAWSAQGLTGRINRLGIAIILVFAIASIVDYPLRTPTLAAVMGLASIWATLPPPAQNAKKGNRLHG